MQPTPVLSEPSWSFRSTHAEGHVSVAGAHVGPVRFRLGERTVEPYHVAPWHAEGRADLPPILRVLRGDFFCMPFGASDEPVDGVVHPVHGESANLDWELAEAEDNALTLRLHAPLTGANLTRRVSARSGQPALYQEQTLAGLSGRMTFGMHAMLAFRSPGRVGVGRFAQGQVLPGSFEDPAKGGYSCLRPGAPFTSLERVPRADGDFADLTRYPAREGFEDLVQVWADPARALGWTAVAFPSEGFAWIQLKDARVLTGTVLWHSNGGRHYDPWNGRHRGVMGLEEVTSYFHLGLVAGLDNPARDRGLKTHHEFEPDRPLVVRTLHVLAEIPPTFGTPTDVEREGKGVVLKDELGNEARAECDPDWVLGA